jgi:hypothetical protein
MDKNFGELVQTYLTIRNERDRIDAEYKANVEALNKDLDVLSRSMLKICNDINANSIKTPQGTILKQLKERFICSDRDSLNKFIRETGAVELFESRIHQGNFKQFMSEKSDEGLPEGVNVMREFTISVRKPKND